MKRFRFAFIFSMALLLIGCNQEDDFDMEKAQKVEIFSAEDRLEVLNTLDEKDEVSDFFENIKMDEWVMADLPSEDLTKGNIYKFYQADTIKLGESEKTQKDLKETSVITTYKDSAYIRVKTNIVTVIYKVPEDVAEYLNKVQ